MFTLPKRKMPNPKPKSMMCMCGKDGTDGYTTYVPHTQKHKPDVPVRLCTECYEKEVRSMTGRRRTSSSVTRGYYV